MYLPDHFKKQSSETPNNKLVLRNPEPLLYLEFNKPDKQNIYGIYSFNKFNFTQSQKITVDTLIRVGNAKHQNITS